MGKHPAGVAKGGGSCTPGRSLFHGGEGVRGELWQLSQATGVLVTWKATPSDGRGPRLAWGVPGTGVSRCLCLSSKGGSVWHWWRPAPKRDVWRPEGWSWGWSGGLAVDYEFNPAKPAGRAIVRWHCHTPDLVADERLLHPTIGVLAD